MIYKILQDLTLYGQKGKKHKKEKTGKEELAIMEVAHKMAPDEHLQPFN